MAVNDEKARSEALGLQRVARLLTQAERALTRHLARTLEREGSTVYEWRTLTLLVDGGSRPMSEIAEFANGNIANHEPARPRKLLLHKREIDALIGKTRERGLTLVPTRLYFKDGRVKIELALARGKEKGDKRADVKERDARREIDRALKARR